MCFRIREVGNVEKNGCYINIDRDRDSSLNASARRQEREKFEARIKSAQNQNSCKQLITMQS